MLNNNQHTGWIGLGGIILDIHHLRNSAGREEIDYLFLKTAMSSLKHPRNKINRFLSDKKLIRVKKGLYIFGPDAAREPFCRELLANLIYGPSAISLEYALSYYGLIPERVFTITSITSKRNKHFSTPIGEFSYRYLHLDKYVVGITLKQVDERHSIFIATPEKALADVLLFSSPLKLKNSLQLEHYLFEDLRMDEESLLSLNQTHMKDIALAYQHPNVTLLSRYLMK